MVRPASDRIGRALDVLGDQWVLLILQLAFRRVRRFNDFRDTLGISEAVLAARLRTLVDAGVFYRRPYRDERRTRDEYRLTDAGLELWQILVAIWAWEYRWVPGRSDELPVLLHDLCHGASVPVLVCRGCGDETSARDTEAHRDPHRVVADAAPPRRFRRSGWESIADRPELFFPETMTILGDRWSTALTAAAFLGVGRFKELQQELSIQPSVLSQRLGTLVDHGVLERRQTDGRRAVRYHLADKGLAFFPVFALVIAWADRWFADIPASLTIEHRACGDQLRPALACDGCRVILARSQVHFARPDEPRWPATSPLLQDRRPSPTPR
jgi:DNA-binding HxlR family transcriptional regulator